MDGESDGQNKEAKQSPVINCDYPNCHLCDEPFCVLDASIKKDLVRNRPGFPTFKIEG